MRRRNIISDNFGHTRFSTEHDIPANSIKPNPQSKFPATYVNMYVMTVAYQIKA